MRYAQIPLGSSRHVSTRPVRRVERVVTSVSRLSSVSSRACSNTADDKEAVVLACTSLVFCALEFESISGTTSGKSEVDMSTTVHAVVTPLNTCRASRACRARHDERVAPCCPTSASRLDTCYIFMSRCDFSVCQNAWAR